MSAADYEPQARHAVLYPVMVRCICPVCAVEWDVDLSDDDSGEWRVRPEDRWHLCDCGALVDVGWTGWPAHNATG